MNNEVAEATSQFSVYTVRGTNWICHVPMDEFNSQFEDEMQAAETASRALEVMMGMESRHNLVLIYDKGEVDPYVGGVVTVYLKDTDPDNGYLFFAADHFADIGLYSVSYNNQILANKYLHELAEKYKGKKKYHDRILEEIKKFELFQKEMEELKNTTPAAEKSVLKPKLKPKKKRKK